MKLRAGVVALAGLVAITAAGACRRGRPPAVESTHAPTPRRAPSPAERVDPFIGSAGPGARSGACMPGPCLPHASIYPSPDTLSPTPGGYRAGQPIVGFAQLHTQGTGGVTSYGNFLVTPRIGLATREADHASPKADESATAGRYAVRLTKFDVHAEVVPARHAALYRFTFPPSDDAHLVIDVARKIGGEVALDRGSVKIDPATGLVTGGGTFSKNWNPAPYEVYFAARVSAAPAAVGTWVGDAVRAGQPEARAEGQSLGAFLRFDTTRGEPILLKIAVSFTSVEKAQRWLDAEIPAWDPDALQANAMREWERALAAVTVEGASPEEERKIYTALWHAMVQPRDRTGDVAGYDPAQPLWDDHYTLWDTWRTLFPLLAIVRPETVRDNVRSFVHRHRHNPDGYVAEAFIQGKEFKVGQGGNETDNVIVDAFVRGVPGVDWRQAYAVVRHHAERARTAHYRERGWVASDDKHDYSVRMKSGSGTLSFAYNDFNAARMALGLNEPADHARYLARSGNWRNVWDDALEVEGFRGFVHGRRRDGTFAATDAPPGAPRREREGYNRDFYEGTWWEYSNDVPHDVPGLTEKMGGRDAYVRRLLHAFRHGYVDFSNEPSFLTVWRFAELGRPYLTSHWADQLRRRFDGRDLPGDEDAGAMSSLFVFLTAGFFPIGGQDVYLLHGARVPRIAFHLSGGKTFTVIGEGAGPESPFVQSATLDGRPLDEPRIRHADILAGRTLKFVMGPRPSAWATGGGFDAVAAANELAGGE